MGAVYLATEVALGRLVAIKVLSPSLAKNERFRIRFEHEARAAAAISHPNVVRVYTVGEAPGNPPLPYIIMQYVEGIALDKMLQEKTTFSERRARRILHDVAAALAAAHERDLVHRDIKPSNILIETETSRVYVADFGISVALSPRGVGGVQPIADDGLIMGTARYMSPEQAAGDVVGPKSDVYSLGVVAYEILSGTMPFEARSAAEWRGAHMIREPAPLRERRTGISTDLLHLVDRCLIKDPGARPLASALAVELLPSAENEIQWPPPGLAILRQQGHWLRVAATVVIAASIIFLGCLAVPLAGTHSGAGWWTAWAGGSVVAVEAAGGPDGRAIVLWSVVVLLSTLALSVGLGLMTISALRTRRTTVQMKVRGWKTGTIHDVLADPDGRTGLVLSGAAEFANKPPEELERICRLRWRSHAALIATATWIALIMAVWSVSVLVGSPLEPAGGRPVGKVQSMMVGIPVFFGLLVMGAALIQERLATGTPWRRPYTGPFKPGSDFTAADIATWYAELPGDPGTQITNAVAHPFLARLMELIAVLLSGWTILSILLLVASTFFAGALVRRLGADTATLADRIEQTRGKSANGAGDAVANYLPAGDPHASPDTLLVKLFAGSTQGLPAYPAEPRAVLGAHDSGLAPATLVRDALRRSKEFSADTLKLMSELGDHARTRVLRSLARVPDLKFPAEGDVESSIRRAMEANAAGAVAAAARGDFDGASHRLGENVAIAKAALASPGSYWPEMGLRSMQSLALLPLAEVERLRGNRKRESDLVGAATRVAEDTYKFGPSMRLGAIGLGSDPRDLSVLRRFRDDGSVPSGLRSATLEASGDAVCLNPREWLAGAHPLRGTALDGSQMVPTVFRSHGIQGIFRRIKYCVGFSNF